MMESIDANQLLVLFSFAVTGYLLGSIPFGLLLTKSAGMGDIRKTGSGNIGATNVLRTGNKQIALLTLLLDMAKAAVAVTLALLYPALDVTAPSSIPGLIPYITALFALIGHMFPIWLKGKGGKGVACYFGVLLSLSWPVFLIAAVNWIIMFVLKRISSLSALFAVAFVPFWLYIFTDMRGFLFGGVYSLLIVLKHWSNIGRLIRGEEQPFGKKAPQSQDKVEV